MAKKKIRRLKNLTLQFVTFAELEGLSSYKKVKKLLDMVEEKKILIIQAKLSPEEESDLIEETMKKIGKAKKFKGIELAVFSPTMKKASGFSKFKKRLADLIGGERDVLTIIGPASIIKEIKKDPTKMQLLLKT